MDGAIIVQLNWFSCPIRVLEKFTTSFHFHPLAVDVFSTSLFEQLQPWPIH